ncbi:hypothetical protein [Thalassotalea aquiviva]|uniref:hypothetical protein n=1 Tax=Thalassotalea aquiviva TaxID=3242415 RepID=UPI00352B32D3
MSNEMPYELSCKANYLKALEGDKTSQYFLLWKLIEKLEFKGLEPMPDDVADYLMQVLINLADSRLHGSSATNNLFPNNPRNPKNYVFKHKVYEYYEKTKIELRQQQVTDSHNKAVELTSDEFNISEKAVEKHVTEMKKHFSRVFE